MKKDTLMQEAYDRIQEPESIRKQELALEKEQFEVWYQPQFDHITETMVGAEALLRWRHPVQGLITPEYFLKDFEESGFICQLDHYVWEQVCILQRELEDAHCPQVPIAVNLSVLDLKQEDLIRDLTNLLHQYTLSPELLCLEIGETILIDADEEMKHKIVTLRELGFTVLIDRYGSQYGSLNMLKDIPTDAVKLDINFLRKSAEIDRSGNIVESLLRMTRWLGMDTVAVGVENLQNAEYLKSIGCIHIQGHLYARPLPREEFLGVLKQQIRVDRIASTEMAELYDSSQFWNPQSLETLIFNSFIGGACVFEYQNRKVEIIRANDKYIRILCGDMVNSKDALHLEWDKYLNPTSKESSIKAMQRAIDTGTEVTDELSLKGFRRTGDTVLLRAKMRVIASTGERYLFYCVIEDITELRAIERRESQLRAQIELIIDNVGCGITAVILDENSAHYVFTNDEYYSMLGYTREQYHAEVDNPYMTIYSEDRERIIAAVNNIGMDEPLRLEFRVICRDGSVKDVRSVSVNRIMPGDGRIAQMTVYSDVSDEKREEERQKELLDHLPCGAGIFDISEGTICAIYLNRRYWELVGRTPSKEGLLPVMDFIQMEDRAYLPMVIQRIVLTGEEQECEIHVQHGDGHYVPFVVRANLFRYHSGRRTLYVTYTPVGEETLNYRQMLPVAFRTMLSSTTDISFVKDRTFTYVCASRVFAEMVGLKDENDIIGKTDYDLFEKKYADQYRADDKRLFRSKRSLVDYMQSLTTKGGGTRYCTKSKFLLQDQNDNVIGIYGVCHDVTQAKETSDRLNLLEGDLRRKYEQERQLRRGLIQDSFLYYQWNLTKRAIEDYQSVYPSYLIKNLPLEENRFLEQSVIPNILSKDLEEVRETLFGDALRGMCLRGERITSCIYRRLLPDREYHWVKMDAFIIDQPDTGDSIAFLHCRNVDKDQKKLLSINAILEEDIEYIIYVNVNTGKARTLHMVDRIKYYDLDTEFDFAKEYGRYCDEKVTLEDRESFRRFYNIPNLKEYLEKEKQLSFTYQVEQNGQERRKLMKACYLDEFKDTIILTRRDITELYEEEQLQKRQLQEAVELANEANHAKSEFLSHMSHDIRTPLNAVMAFSNPEILEGADEAKLRGYLGKVNTSGEYLLGIINDVLDMSRIEQKRIKMNPEPYYLPDFEDTIRNVIGTLCKNRDIEFVMNTEQSGTRGIIVDHVRFNQIFINLLSNAAKFTQPGGKVEFMIEELKSSNEPMVHKRFIVRDNGIGMSDDFIPHAFESFNQEYRKDTSERNQGTGLGLSIVKELVRLMDGTICLESKLNEGTTFTVDIPFEAVSVVSQKKAEEKHDYSRLNGIRILLGEDNDINTEIATLLLEKKGCIVERAVNGEEACAMFEASEEFYYQLILMDIRMPVMDGLTATKRIRAMKRKDAKKIPVIAMTADAFNEDEQVAYKAGMNAHIAKPIDPAQMYDACCKLINVTETIHGDDKKRKN